LHVTSMRRLTDGVREQGEKHRDPQLLNTAM
jgi:hypothetical protein